MPDSKVENPKEAFGRLKPCLHKVPMHVMLEVAGVMEIGAAKYGLKNWRVQPINASTYYSAVLRHLIAWFECGEDADPESNKHHLAHVMACCAIVIDGLDRGTLLDDRAFAEALHTNQAKLASPTSRE